VDKKTTDFWKKNKLFYEEEEEDFQVFVTWQASPLCSWIWFGELYYYYYYCYYYLTSFATHDGKVKLQTHTHTHRHAHMLKFTMSILLPHLPQFNTISKPFFFSLSGLWRRMFESSQNNTTVENRRPPPLHTYFWLP
jgi:hypothetical protein